MLPELWIKIFEQLDCATILNIKLTCKNFNRICVKNELYIKRKFRGFPRLEGKCKIYSIGQLFCDSHGNIPKENENKIIEFIEKGIQYDFIRGDVICFGNYKNQYTDKGGCIFDGQKLMDFNSIYHTNCWPNKFRIINNDIPMGYWFFTYMITWIDSTEYKQKLISNIYYDNTIFTKFNHNEKEYTIIYDDLGNKKRTIDESIKNAKEFFHAYKLLLVHINNPSASNTMIYISEESYIVNNKLGCSLYEYLVR